MSKRTKLALADAAVTIALIFFGIRTFHQLHGWHLWLAFAGYCIAFLALGYMNETAKTPPPVIRPSSDLFRWDPS